MKGTNRTPSHDSRYLLSELQVPHAQCFKAFFHLLQVSCHRSRGFNVPPPPPQQKRAYSALHPQALTECSPWISEDRLLTIFTTSGNAWARVSFRKHGSASGRVYGSDKTAERNQNIFFFFFLILFILEIVKIRRSPYAHFNLRINTDVLSPMYLCFCARMALTVFVHSFCTQ